jgi:ADP-heptose:LPS heptosyltransferase
MILINGNYKIGDCLYSFPAIIELAKQNNGLYIQMYHEGMWELLPKEKYNIKKLNDLEHERIPHLSTWPVKIIDAWTNEPPHIFTGMHASQGYFDLLGLPVPPEIPIVEIEYPEIKLDDSMIYDYIFAPFSISDDGHKEWRPYSQWEVLAEKLQPAKIAIFANKEQPQFMQKDYIDWLVNIDLKLVCNIIKNVKKCVVTIDSGPSHLTHGVGANHVLIYPHVTPPNWAKNPRNNSIQVQANVRDLSVDRVLEAINKFN